MSEEAVITKYTRGISISRSQIVLLPLSTGIMNNVTPKQELELETVPYFFVHGLCDKTPEINHCGQCSIWFNSRTTIQRFSYSGGPRAIWGGVGVKWVISFGDKINNNPRKYAFHMLRLSRPFFFFLFYGASSTSSFGGIEEEEEKGNEPIESQMLFPVKSNTIEMHRPPSTSTAELTWMN